MKKILFLLTVAISFAGIANGATVSSAIQGTVSNPTTNTGTALADTTYAILIVDTSGAGLSGLTTTLNLVEGSTYGNLYVASIFASTNTFLGVGAASPVTTVTWDDTAVASTVANNGDKYYIVWYQGRTGATTASTQLTVTNGQVYGYASASDWLVPASGSTNTPNSVSTGFVYGTVAVPEPSVALLGAIGGLALLRRRRN